MFRRRTLPSRSEYALEVHATIFRLGLAACMESHLAILFNLIWSTLAPCQKGKGGKEGVGDTVRKRRNERPTDRHGEEGRSDAKGNKSKERTEWERERGEKEGGEEEGQRDHT